jgi:predicted DNA binding CopG/RHH family protein
MTKRKSSPDEQLTHDYELGALISTKPGKTGMHRLQQAARATLAKDRRVNIRVPSRVLEGLRARATEEGLPYQTLISSVLHKYVSGRFVEKVPRSSRR